LTAGNEVVIGVNGNGISSQMVENRFSSVDPNTAAENLQQTALNFWMMHDFYDDLTAQIHQVRRVRLPSVGLFVSPLTVSYFYGIARNGIYKSRVIDVQQNIQAVVAPSFEARFEYMSQIGIYGSYLENSVIEELFDYELGRGVSATQVLLEANAQQIPIYAITAENIDTVLPLLSVSQEVKTDIINGIHAGQHAIVPQREIQHGNWQGSGYIIQDSITGAGAYLLEGGLNGGALEGLSCDASKNPMAALINMVIQVMELYFNIVAMISFGSLALAAVALVTFRIMVKTLLKAVVKKQVKKKRAKKRKKKKRTECDCEPKKTRQGKRQENFCLDIFSLAFGAKNQANYLQIWRDEVGKEPKLIENPVWEDQNTSDENDKNRLGYVSGARLKISEAKFRITQKPKNLSQTVTIIGKAKTSQGFFTFSDEHAMMKKDEIVAKDMLANNSLMEKGTQFFNPMTIEWRVKYKKGGKPKTKVLGTSKHQVYVTLEKPLKDKLYLTSLHLATSDQGATGKTVGQAKKQAIHKTWKFFKTKKITNWNNQPLYYYKHGHRFSDLTCGKNPIHSRFQLLGEFLNSGKGQCDAFERLFEAALVANGIRSELVDVYTKNDDEVLSKNWAFPLMPSFDDTGAYQWRLILKEEGVGDNGKMMYGMVPANQNNKYGELVSQVGLAGQNSPTLSEKVFGVHYIVKITDLEAISDGHLTTFYYDPSYGVTYSGEKEESEQNFETDAVAGYYRAFHDPGQPDENEEPSHFRARKHDDLNNIIFSK
ncbi:MAG: hypothetical protein DRR00_31180, partial [Candidatus Parabeggiatoa sp. nov. 3]